MRRTEASPDLCDSTRATALGANAAKEASFRTESGYDERGHVDGERKRGGGADEDEKGQYSLCAGNQMEGEQSEGIG